MVKWWDGGVGGRRPLDENASQLQLVEGISDEVDFAGGPCSSKVMLDNRGDPEEGNSKNNTKETTPTRTRKRNRFWERNGTVFGRELESTPVPFLGTKFGPQIGPFKYKLHMRRNRFRYPFLEPPRRKKRGPREANGRFFLNQYRCFWHLILSTFHLLPTTYYLLPTTYYLLPTTYYLLPTTCYLLLLQLLRTTTSIASCSSSTTLPIVLLKKILFYCCRIGLKLFSLVVLALKPLAFRVPMLSVIDFPLSDMHKCAKRH